MKRLTYKVIEENGEYVGICVQKPHITWIADTAEEAFEGVEEMAFQFHLDRNEDSELNYLEN